MDTKTLLEQANERVKNINRIMGELEDFEAVLSVTGASKVALHSNGGTTFIDTVLSQDDMVDLQDMVVTRIIGARNKKTAELEQLLGVEKRKPAIINPEFKNAVQKMVETDKCPKAGGRKVIELDEEQIRDLYVNKGMSYKGIAEKLKCSDFTIRKFCNQHGIIREAIPKNKLTYPVMTVEAVREIYTNGSTSLVDTAKYFGVNSNELHKFIEKHGLKRLVIKQNDPFLDVNKMSKDEFRRKMLLGKK